MAMLTRYLMLLSALAGLAACSPPDREAELAAFIDAAVAAVETRDTGWFRAHIDAAYRDTQGRDRDAVIRLIRGYFVANQRIDAVSRMQQVNFDGDDFAEVVVQAAVVGHRGGGVFDLDADLQTLALELARDGHRWKLIGADWEH